MDFVTKFKSWILPDEPQQKIMNIGNNVPQTPAPTHDHFPPHNPNFNENIVTTSVFIVMVLIFIGVLLIACCKVLIGCTARSFLGTSNSPAHRTTTASRQATQNNSANMIYTINGQTVLANGQAIPASLQPNNHNNNASLQQPPQLPRTSSTGHPPNYDDLSVHSLPPVYQFEADKSESEKGNNSGGETNENEELELAIQESVKTNSNAGSVIVMEDIVVKSQDSGGSESDEDVDNEFDTGNDDERSDVSNGARNDARNDARHCARQSDNRRSRGAKTGDDVKSGSDDDNATSHV